MLLIKSLIKSFCLRQTEAGLKPLKLRRPKVVEKKLLQDEGALE